MIIDDLVNAKKYFCIHPLFKEAFAYINSQDFESIQPGKNEIKREELKAIISNNPGKTKEESTAKFECHDHHLDIQLCIKGKEEIGWKPRHTCTHRKGEYNPEKDVTFYNEVPDMYFQLTDNQFAIFFPEDVHAPMIGDADIKKMVIKVKI